MDDLVLKCDLPLGEAVLLTAAVRDLHLSYPGRFRTGVETPFPDLWENNPYITPLNKLGRKARVIRCSLSLVDRSNVLPYHCIHGFIHNLNEQLGLKIRPTVFKGDIHISVEEKNWCSQVHELTGKDTPFWIVVAGGKFDFTAKWWAPDRHQTVVEHFRGRIQFVQVGAQEHYHPSLDGVIDLRGKTDLRELVRLVYHAQGVLCPVTSLMHLAAAVEVKGGIPKNRPCVVIAGGREPSQWEAYPHHQFIHTGGGLLCCDEGGCWKSRVRPLHDGSELDQVENLCVDVVGSLPRCLHLITPAQVIRRIELYFEGGAIRFLAPEQYQSTSHAIAIGNANSWSKQELECYSYRRMSEQFIASIPPCPKFSGRGIVICAGGVKYFSNAWVCIQMLRKFGCKLPIQLWHLGKTELDERMRALVKPAGVESVDALQISSRPLHGWALKPYAILHSPFQELLFLDADNVPVRNPEYLFETQEFKETGALFWPDIGRMSKDHPIWKICGVPYRDEPEFESGQIVLDKTRVWGALALTMWYNEHSDFYYQYIYGDKDTFRMAFRKLDVPYCIPKSPAVKRGGVTFQNDFEGNRIFQHRSFDKWDLNFVPNRVAEFQFHDDCVNFLKSLRRQWDGGIAGVSGGLKSGEAGALFKKITHIRYEFHAIGSFRNEVSFTCDGRVQTRLRDLEFTWKLRARKARRFWEIYAKNKLVVRMGPRRNGSWQGFDRESGSRVKVSPIKNSHRGKRDDREKIWIRAPVNACTGRGLHAFQVISAFHRWNYDVRVVPSGLDEKYGETPDWICDRLHYEKTDNDWELLIHDPKQAPRPGKRTVYFTRWESTELPDYALEHLNAAELVIVPCQWNADCFAAQGVRRPIRVMPLGIDTRLFRYSPMPSDGPCIFGAAAGVLNAGAGNGVEQVMKAFREAFPSQSDVRLFVKTFPDCDMPAARDRRITAVRRYFTQQEMAQWYRSITCFVSSGRGGAGGLMQREALATGRPVAAVQYAGVTELFDETMGYPVAYRLVATDERYGNSGQWAEPDRSSLIEQMRQVYCDRNEAAVRGQRGATAVSQFSWQRSNRGLLQLLREIGMVR